MPSRSGLTPTASGMSTWLDPPSMFSMFRTSSSLPATADLAIIGNGFSGASVAYHALKAYPGMNIVMLEAGDICDGASGRNGGQLRPDFYSYTSEVVEKYGPAEALRQNKFERDNYNALKKLIEEEGIDCESQTEGESCQVFLDEQEFKDALSNLASMHNLGGDVHDVRVYMQAEAVKITGIPGCFGAIASPASPISPTKLVTHLLEKSLLQGLNLQTHTRVLSVTRNSSPFSSPNSSSASDSEAEDFENVDIGSLRISPKKSAYLHKVVTTRGTLLVNKVVHATNAYLDTLLAISSDVLDTTKSQNTSVLVTPVRGHVIEIAPTGTSARKLSLDPCHNITNMSFNKGGEYLIQRPNGNFVLGGGRRFGRNKGVESFASTSTKEAETDEAVDLYLRYFFTQTLGFDPAHYLESPKAVLGETAATAPYTAHYKIVKQWTGIMGFSKDNFPLVGKIPSFFLEQAQEYCIAGFTGHGMPRIYLAAEALVHMILQEDEEYKYDCLYHSNVGSMSESYFNGMLPASDSVLPECFKITEERLTAMISLTRLDS